MVLVTGATGHLGKQTIQFLLKKIPASSIAALARQPEKLQDLKDAGVEIRQGDYNDIASLVTAFRGVEKLLFISSSEVFGRIQQHSNVVKAATDAGVKHIFYTSFQRKTDNASSPVAFITKDHIDTEKLIQQSGMKYTFLRNGLYADGISMFIGENVLETGTIFLPAGDGKTSFVARKNLAEATANILVESGHENKSYDLSSPVSYSYADIAAILTEVSGKKVTYVPAAREAFTEAMTKAGVPPEYIAVSAGFNEAIKQGEFDIPDPTLERILGHPSISMKELLQQKYSPSKEKEV